MFAMPHETVHVHEVGDGKDKDRNQERHNQLQRDQDQAKQEVQQVDWDTPAKLLPPIHVFVFKVQRLEEEGLEDFVQGTDEGDKCQDGDEDEPQQEFDVIPAARCQLGLPLRGF